MDSRRFEILDLEKPAPKIKQTKGGDLLCSVALTGVPESVVMAMLTEHGFDVRRFNGERWVFDRNEAPCGKLKYDEEKPEETAGTPVQVVNVPSVSGAQIPRFRPAPGVGGLSDGTSGYTGSSVSGYTGSFFGGIAGLAGGLFGPRRNSGFPGPG